MTFIEDDPFSGLSLHTLVFSCPVMVRTTFGSGKTLARHGTNDKEESGGF